MIYNLFKKQWLKGLFNLIPIIVFTIATFIASIAFMFGPSDDGFADNLTIPDNIETAEPTNPSYEAYKLPKYDLYQQTILKALSMQGTSDATITVNINNLIKLKNNNEKVLLRYLATSPCWRVYKERGNLYATRRWMIGDEWIYSLHGYYTLHDINIVEDLNLDYFQNRLTIGFSQKPWARISKNDTVLKPGQTEKLKLSIGNDSYESRCLINTNNLVIDIFEQSDEKERRITKAAIDYINSEFMQLLKQPTWNTIQTNIPTGSIRTGTPSLELKNSFQPGIYDSILWINPQEPGLIYFKAFEVTQETPLSVHRLKEKSNERIGWSENPDELFFSNTHFTIYEGDWGKPYAARFEVWFKPDADKKERKLMEKIFKIEGWQR